MSSCCPDYLERLQGGHKDIPIVLLPLLNELRAARGETGLSESVLFAPNLDRPLPENLPAPMALPRQSRQLMAGQQLSALREALAQWPEDGAPTNIGGIAKAIEGLLESADHEGTRRMLWVASSVATALRDGALPATKALRQAFAGVEREARHIFEGDGFNAPRGEPTAEPTRQLLYHVAHNEQAHNALDALRDTFDLAAQMPTESELAHARGSLSGRNRALLDTVAAAIKEDLLRVKDALDLHLRTKQTGVSGLLPQVEALSRVADTLGMMGLGVARNVVLQQRDAMHEIVAGNRSADEGALLDIAGALLYVDASLDDQVARLGRADSEENDTIAGESRKVLDILIREAIANFADARQAFVAFVETSWDHSQLTDVPRLLDEVGGALRILEVPQPAEYLVGVARYTKNELLARKRVPNGQQLDTLADALASIEYYLEALRDNRPNREGILDIARQSLETLHYWPLPAEDAKAAGSRSDLRHRHDAEDRSLERRRLRTDAARQRLRSDRIRLRADAARRRGACRRTRARRHRRRRRFRSDQRRHRRRNPRSVPRGIRRRDRPPRIDAARLARRTGRQRQAASDPSRVPHAEGVRPPRRRQDARRVQLEGREHAQPRARRHASAVRRGHRARRPGLLHAAAPARRAARRSTADRGPCGHRSDRRTRRRG